MNFRHLRQAITDRILALLHEGMTPEKIALSIALGITLGVTPVLGSTSLLCTLAAMVLRLNLPAIQLVNYFAYPLQIALLIPFLKLGAWIFGTSPVSLTVSGIYHLIRADFWGAIDTLWTATMGALAVWFVLGSLACLLIYALLTPVCRRLALSMETGSR